MDIALLRTLADPSRLQIVEVLRGGERSVNDVVEGTDIQQSGVSRHLRILQEAHVVRVRKDGARRLYSLCPEPFAELEAWAAEFRGLWEARLDRLSVALGESAAPTRESAPPTATAKPGKHKKHKKHKRGHKR